MSDDVTFEVDCDTSAEELKGVLSGLWRGESVEVMPATTEGMRWLVVLSYYYYGSQARASQRAEIESVVRYLLAVSSLDYIFYYRSSETVEVAGLQPCILEPRSIFEPNFQPAMVSGYQSKYVLVSNEETARGLPKVHILAKWRFVCDSDVSPQALSNGIRESIYPNDYNITVEYHAEGTVVVSLAMRPEPQYESLLSILSFLRQQSSEGVVFYCPVQGNIPGKDAIGSTIGVDKLFDDNFRLGAEEVGPQRYPIRGGDVRTVK